MPSNEDYIDPNDAVFVAWSANFFTVLNANLAAVGLVAGDVTPVSNARDAFSPRVYRSGRQRSRRNRRRRPQAHTPHHLCSPTPRPRQARSGASRHDRFPARDNSASPFPSAPAPVAASERKFPAWYWNPSPVRSSSISATIPATSRPTANRHGRQAATSIASSPKTSISFSSPSIPPRPMWIPSEARRGTCPTKRHIAAFAHRTKAHPHRSRPSRQAAEDKHTWRQPPFDTRR